MADKQPGRGKFKLYRLSGIGVELTGAVLGGWLLGWYLDHKLGTSYWMLSLTLVGIVGGLYNLVKQSLRVVHDEQQSLEAHDDVGNSD